MNATRRIARFCASALTLVVLLTAFGALPGRAQSGGLSAALLSDGQFVYGPNAYDFDIPAWIETRAPHLMPYAAPLEGLAAYASVNPRLLLTLMELRTGLLSDPAADPENPFGWDETGFSGQVEAVNAVLTNAYYLHLHQYSALDPAERSLPPLTLADGSELAVAPEVNAGTYAVLAFLARTETADSLPAALQAFPALWADSFPGDDPLDESNQVYIPGSLTAQEIPPPSLLELPFARGQSWWFGGVHHNLGITGSDASSIDFANEWRYWMCPDPPDCMEGYAPYDLTPYPIRAAHADWITTIPGTRYGITAPCQATVYSRHDRTGWATRYYHLENVQAAPYVLSPIAQNQVLGYMADTKKEALCNGGDSSGHHVHFSLMFNGAFVPIEGAALSGWVVHGEYDNFGNLVAYGNGTYLSRDGTTIYAGGSVLNDYTPLTPDPLSPANGALLARTEPVVVSWTLRAEAQAYYVELLQGGTPIANSGWITATSYDFGLRPSGDYTWHVKARDASLEESPWSAAWALSVTAPDLEVTSLTAIPSLAMVGQPVQVQVVVTNVGTEAVPAGGFRLDLYLDRAPSGCGDFGDYSTVIASLAPGASQTVTFDLPGFPAVGDHSLRAYADSACLVEEVGEANNQRGPLPLGVRAPLPAGMHDDTDARIFYTGPWTTWDSGDLYGGSAHWVTAQGSAAEFIIQGSQFILTFTKDDDYGDVDVYVDGVYLATIEQHFDGSYTFFQQTWASPDLGGGLHLVRLVQAGPLGMEVDAVRVKAYVPPPAPPSNLQAVYAYDPSRVILTWTLSPDDGDLDGYRIFRNDSIVDEVVHGVAGPREGPRGPGGEGRRERGGV